MSDSTEVTASKVAGGTTRLYYLDWLRILAIIAIFFFHNSRFFNDNSWHVTNTENNLGAALFVEFCNLWVMPLFFILAGAAIFYALKSRTADGFAKERTLRILVPIVILGWFVIAPPQVYLERLSHGDFSGSFFQFYFSNYFNGIYGLTEGGNFAIVPIHMWFLWLLFIYSLILLPLFIPNRNTGNSPLARFAKLFNKPWTFVVPVLLLATSEVFLDFVEWGGGWNHISYLVFFISGYLIFSNAKIQENIRKYAVMSLIAALFLQALHYLLKFGLIEIAYPESTLVYMGFWTFGTLRSWLFIVTILGFGSRYLNFSNRFLGYASEAVLPFYILHQTVIIIIGFFVVQWSIDIAPKYIITSMVSLVIIMVIYELLVRRINILRFLFGMRSKEE